MMRPMQIVAMVLRELVVVTCLLHAIPAWAEVTVPPSRPASEVKRSIMIGVGIPNLMKQPHSTAALAVSLWLSGAPSAQELRLGESAAAAYLRLPDVNPFGREQS